MSRTRHVARAAVALAAAASLAVPAIAQAAGGRPPGSGGGRGGGTETSIGNNLSNPVVFASGVGVLGLKGAATATGFDATWTGLRIPPTAAGQFESPVTWTIDGTAKTVYPQAMEKNSWQAGYLYNDPATASYATVGAFGDNILGENTATVKAFAVSSAIHLEASLAPKTAPEGLADLPYMPMISNGLTGSSEKWAASQNSMSTGATSSTVFTGGAYLRIVQVTSPDDLTPVTGGFDKTYPVSVTFVSTTETESGGSTGGTAPMRLAGEVNASGNVVYGMNLFPQQAGMAAGYYRLSFGINSSFTDNAAEGAEITSGATLAGTAADNSATYDPSDHTINAVIQITSDRTGHRGGGGGTGHGRGTR